MTGTPQHLGYLISVITTKRVTLIDACRDKVDDAHLRALLDVYWTLPEWVQKCVLVGIIQDHLVGRRAELADGPDLHAAVEAVATDILRAPRDDSAAVAFPKICALRYLTGVDHFKSSFDDVRTSVRAELAVRGPAALRRLVDQALHDDERRAGHAAYAVMLGFDSCDPTPAELAAIGEAIAVDGVPIERVERLRFRLKEKAAPLILGLLRDERPGWRCAGVRLAAEALTPDTWLLALGDPLPDVRHAAVLKLTASHWLPDDNPRKPADYKARLRAALADPSRMVRLAAAGSAYSDMERNAIVARMIAETVDPVEKTALRWALVRADDWEPTRWDRASFSRPEIRAALVAMPEDPDVELRRTWLERIGLLVELQSVDADMTDFQVAAAQARLSLAAIGDGAS